MHQTFNAVFKFHKSTVIGDVGDLTGNFRAKLKFRRCFIPRVGLKLFHAKTDTLRFGVDFNHLHAHRFADTQHF